MTELGRLVGLSVVELTGADCTGLSSNVNLYTPIFPLSQSNCTDNAHQNYEIDHWFTKLKYL